MQPQDLFPREEMGVAHQAAAEVIGGLSTMEPRARMSSTPYDYSSTMADGLRDGITVLLAEMGQEVDGKPAPSRPLVATRAIARALGGPGMRSVAEEFVHWYNGKRDLLAACAPDRAGQRPGPPLEPRRQQVPQRSLRPDTLVAAVQALVDALEAVYADSVG